MRAHRCLLYITRPSTLYPVQTLQRSFHSNERFLHLCSNHTCESLHSEILDDSLTLQDHGISFALQDHGIRSQVHIRDMERYVSLQAFQSHFASSANVRFISDLPNSRQIRVITASQRFEAYCMRYREKRRLLAKPPVDGATMDDVDKEWLALQSYDAALRLNQAYIKGQRPCNIGYCGPLDAETKELIPGLLKLHEYGLLTHSSQPFEPVERKFVDQNGGSWEEWRQRPYLCFLAPQQERIPKEALERFILLLLAHPAIVTYVAYCDGDRSYRTNIDEYHITTGFRYALLPKELVEEDIMVNTAVSASYQHITEDWGNVNAVTRARCLDISVASRSWDEDLDLQKLVEDLAIDAGMERAYSSDGPSSKTSAPVEEDDGPAA